MLCSVECNPSVTITTISSHHPSILSLTWTDRSWMYVTAPTLSGEPYIPRRLELIASIISHVVRVPVIMSELSGEACMRDSHNKYHKVKQAYVHYKECVQMRLLLHQTITKFNRMMNNNVFWWCTVCSPFHCTSLVSYYVNSQMLRLYKLGSFKVSNFVKMV